MKLTQPVLFPSRNGLCLIFLPFNHKASLRQHGEWLRAALGPLDFWGCGPVLGLEEVPFWSQIPLGQPPSSTA